MCEKVWERWSDDSDPTLYGTATLSLAALAELAQQQLTANSPTTSRTVTLPLARPGSHLGTKAAAPEGQADGGEELPEGDDGADGIQPLLEVQLQYEALYFPGNRVQAQHPSSDLDPSDPITDPADTEDAGGKGISSGSIPAILSVTIVQACGLQVRPPFCMTCIFFPAPYLGLCPFSFAIIHTSTP